MVDAIAQGVGSLVSAGAGIYMQNKEMQHQEKMLGLQNQFSLDMWNRAAEYNSPVNEANRLRAAGLSDGAVAQSLSGSAAAGDMPAGQGTSAPQSPHFDLAQNLQNSVNSFFSNKLQIAQAEKLDAEKGELFRVNDAAINNQIAQTNLSNEQANQVREMLKPLIGKTNTEIEKFRSDILLSFQRIDEIRKNMEKTDSDIEKTKSDIHLNESQMEVNHSTAARNYSEVDMNLKKQFEQDFRNAYVQSFGTLPESGFLSKISDLVLSGKGYEHGQTISKAFFDILAGVLKGAYESTPIPSFRKRFRGKLLGNSPSLDSISLGFSPHANGNFQDMRKYGFHR